MAGTDLVEAVEPTWPARHGPFVLLVDASSGVEAKLIAEWYERVAQDVREPVDVFSVPPSRRRRPFASVDPRIDERLSSEDNPLLVPVRVAWLPKERDGMRRVTIRDAFTFGDPRDPNVFQQRSILARHPDRAQIVIGEPAYKSEIVDRWNSPDGRGPADGTTLGEFVALQAWLALERAERLIRGQRYKVPKFLREDLFWSRPFQHGVHELALEEGKSDKRMAARTGRYLKEIAALPTPYVIDMVNHATQLLINAAHHSVDYSPRDLQAVFEAAEGEPIVFLPSHKSNFDHLVFQHVLFENELPPNHTAGGINMNFFLVGPLLRRSGIFFIRREFKKNEPYKFVLRQYIDYLLEKRFSLEWYIEGGRSRTGKLREPRLGMLAYVVDSYRRGIVDDVVLVPVSINYDQIADVASYAEEQRGAKKEKESLAWAVKFITGLRKSHGSIHLRFGDPLPISTRIGKDDDLSSEEGRLALPKVAFEVSTRINDATPITSTSLVTLALLGSGTRGHTVDETISILDPFLEFVAERDLPTTFDHRFASRDAVESALEALRANGVVSRIDGLTERVYSIGHEHTLEAAYYRNTIIHFFVNVGITELAIALGVLEDGPMDEESIVQRAVALRDLFKFEFFFSPTKEFEDEIREEIARYRVGDATPDGPVSVDIDSMMPAKSPIVLRPFLEAYYVVASALGTFGDEPVTEEQLAEASLSMGNQLLSQGIIRNAEAVSTTLFSSGIELAENRHLLDADRAARAAFEHELHDALVAVSNVAAL